MIWLINIPKVCLFPTLGTKLLCSNEHWSWDANASITIEEIKNTIKSSVTSPMFFSLLCGHGTNDRNGSEG